MNWTTPSTKAGRLQRCTSHSEFSNKHASEGENELLSASVMHSVVLLSWGALHLLWGVAEEANLDPPAQMMSRQTANICLTQRRYSHCCDIRDVKGQACSKLRQHGISKRPDNTRTVKALLLTGCSHLLAQTAGGTHNERHYVRAESLIHQAATLAAHLHNFSTQNQEV